MKGRGIVIFSSIVGLVLFGYILGDVPLKDIWKVAGDMNGGYILGYLLTSIVIMFNFAWRWGVVLNSQKEKVKFKDLFLFRIADYTISFLTPGPKVGGEFTRAALLETKGVKFSKAFSSSMIDKSLELIANSFIFILGVSIIAVFVEIPLGWRIAFFTLAFLYVGLMIGFYIGMVKGKSLFIFLFKFFKMHEKKKFKNNILDFEKSVTKFYVEDKKHFFIALFFSFLTWVFSFIEYKFLFLMVGIPLSWEQVFLVFTFTGVAYLLPVPLAVGTLEAGQVSVLAIMKLQVSIGVLAAMIIRIRDLLWCVVGIPTMAYYGLSFKSHAKEASKK